MKIQDNEKEVVKGTQEDIDLIVAFDKTLILIEAKGDTAWIPVQLGSKFKRLIEIFGSGGDEPLTDLSIHFVLMSPTAFASESFSKLVGELPEPYPEWLLGENQQPRWLHLYMDKELVKVTRCDESGKPSADGDHWCVK